VNAANVHSRVGATISFGPRSMVAVEPMTENVLRQSRVMKAMARLGRMMVTSSTQYGGSGERHSSTLAGCSPSSTFSCEKINPNAYLK
jgi:hypothetical protein